MKVGCWILFVFVFMNATFIGCRLQVQTSKINYLTSSVYQFITSTLNTKTSAQCWFKIETRTKTAMAESQNSSVHKWEVWFYFNLYTAAPFPARNGQSAFLLPLHDLWVILKFTTAAEKAECQMIWLKEVRAVHRERVNKTGSVFPFLPQLLNYNTTWCSFMSL